MLAETFAAVAASISASIGGPYSPGVARWPGTPVLDDGGSIVTPGVPINASCLVQIDSATDAMRQSEGFRETDVRLLVLGMSLPLDTNATIEVTGKGAYSVESVSRDPAGIGWECRGRAL